MKLSAKYQASTEQKNYVINFTHSMINLLCGILNNKTMITLCVMPNFKGTRQENVQALIVCLFLDMLYILPLTINI